MKKLGYREFTTLVTQGGELPVYEYCNGYTAINTGSDTVVINGMPLLPRPGAGLSGESISVGGNYGEIYTKETIKIVFNSNTAPQVAIIQKVYNEIDFNNV